MRPFLKKIALFLLPILLVIITILSLDIFKVFGTYDDYYEDTFVSLNRGMVTFSIFEQQREKQAYNAFIFGNSRSQAYKCPVWENYLPESAVPFHLDASGEGVYGVAKKLAYLDEIGTSIDHALIVLDRSFLRGVRNRKEHIAIAPPEISGESTYGYYTTFIRANFDPDFLTAYVDYSFTKEYKPYMEELIRNSIYPDSCNEKTGDIYYGYDQWIEEDSLGYYQKLLAEGVFERKPNGNKTLHVIPQEISQLIAIRRIFEQHKTQYKIIISPIYDQIPMEQQQVDLLHRIFGKEHVSNFSGKNEFTNEVGNYYEWSHYKPHVANTILRRVYAE